MCSFTATVVVTHSVKTDNDHVCSCVLVCMYFYVYDVIRYYVLRVPMNLHDLYVMRLVLADAVSADDVMRVVMHMLQSPPTVVLLGDVTNSMEKDEIHALFHSPDTAAAGKSKLCSFFK